MMFQYEHFMTFQYEDLMVLHHRGSNILLTKWFYWIVDSISIEEEMPRICLKMQVGRRPVNVHDQRL